MSKWINIFKRTFSEFSDDNCTELGAALSYYALSSLIPLLLVVASILSIFLTSESGEQYQQQIVQYIGNAIGENVNDCGSEDPQAAQAASGSFTCQLTNTLTGAQSDSSGGIIGTIIGFATLLLAASGVFGQLDFAMNTIWDVPPDKRPSGVMGFITSKLTAFVLVAAVAFFLLVSTVLTASLSAIVQALNLTPPWLFTIINFFVQLAIMSFIFGMIFKYLPDIEISFRDALIGGLVTAALWALGQQLLNLYFGYSSSFSSYGIIGSVLAFLVYVYYSSLILYLGAEFTQVYSRTYGSRQEDAMRDRGITPEGALMVQAAVRGADLAKTRTLREQEQALAATRTKQVAAATTGGIIGLLAGAAIGGAGLVVGLIRGAGRLRGR